MPSAGSLPRRFPARSISRKNWVCRQSTVSKSHGSSLRRCNWLRRSRMVKCAVVGGSGYIGGELIRLLLTHPQANLVAITANEAAGKKLVEEHPNLAGIDMAFGELAAVGDAETLFLALPNGETMKVIGTL